MKKIITIEIETKDLLGIFPDCGKTEDDYTKEELNSFRDEYSNKLMNHLIYRIEHFFNENFEEDVLDDMEELSIENFDDFKDYGISVKVTKQ